MIPNIFLPSCRPTETLNSRPETENTFQVAATFSQRRIAINLDKGLTKQWYQPGDGESVSQTSAIVLVGLRSRRRDHSFQVPDTTQLEASEFELNFKMRCGIFVHRAIEDTSPH